MAIKVVAKPAQLTWGKFRPVDFIDGNEEAETAPETSGLETITPVKLKTGRFVLPSATITVSLNRNDTAVLKTANKTPELLKHEQGHFDILVLVTRAMAKELEGLDALTVSELGDQLEAVKQRHADRAEAINKAYDDQTDHSRNKASQAKWNSAISTAMGATSVDSILSMPL